jgi:ketosteroid isomerase-like protein
MKLITSLLGIAALSFVSSALAQEESPSASPGETASTTVQESATPTPSASPSAKSTTTSEESPAAKKKEKAAATSPSPAASLAAEKPAKKMSVEAALKDNENRWEAAIGKHDMAAVEAMVADDFAGVSSKGKVSNRRSVLSEMKKDKDTYTSAKNEKLDVHMYGASVAVVVGTSREKGTDKDGKAFDRSFRFTDTWLDRNGKWQCIASQINLVSQK